MARGKALQPKQERTSKELVVDAYIQLAFEIGVANITIQKIADKAGIAFSTVRYYFTQEGFDIHAECFKQVMMRSLENVERGFNRLDKKVRSNPVHAYVHSMFNWISEDPTNATYLIYSYYNAASKIRTAVDLVQVNNSARGKVQSALLESIGLELYKPVSGISDCASSIHATVVGHGFIALTANTSESFKIFREQCIATVDALIESCQKARHS